MAKIALVDGFGRRELSSPKPVVRTSRRVDAFPRSVQQPMMERHTQFFSTYVCGLTLVKRLIYETC